MRISANTIHVTMEHDVKVGHNGVIEATLIHQAFVFETKNGDIGVDLDFCDVTNVKFMGLPIEGGYSGYKKFKETMSGLSINVDKLMDEAAASLITDEEINKIKAKCSLALCKLK